MNSYKTGGFAENLVRSLLDVANIPNVKNSASKQTGMIEWDIKIEINGQIFTIEVKFDKMASKTGNLAIEYYNTKSKKPSGILATTSDLWAVVLNEPSSIWLVKTTDLLTFFHNEKPLKDIKYGGDKNASMKIFSKQHILPIFQRIDSIKSSELMSAIAKLLGVVNERAA
jgi:hypothetical protein